MVFRRHPAQALALKDWAFPLSYFPGKKELRQFMRTKRKQQDKRLIRHKNKKITHHVLALDEIQQAHCIAAYASLPDEAGTDALLATLLEHEKHLVLPKVVGQNMKFYRIEDPKETMIRGAFHILEPDPKRCKQVNPAEIDLFIVPGIAFDPFGARIGFGGGYYDRFLSQKLDHVKVIALAFEFQVVHALETLHHDLPVDVIVTEERIYEPRLSSYVTRHEDDTRKFAKQLTMAGWNRNQILALHGDLGTGKTVFVQGIAKAIGAKDSAASPTFIYSREYSGQETLFHIDCYRLDSIMDEDDPFWNEQLSQEGLIAVEWAERLGTLLPKNTFHLFGHVVDHDQREWTLFTPLKEQAILHIEEFRKE